MPDFPLDVTDRPRVRFVVRDHSKIMETVDTLADGIIGETNEGCHFCGEVPFVIVYRGWNDKIVTACKAHEEIVLEMIEREA
jgi:hypothetical protein